MNCRQCGYALNGTESRCPRCGTPLMNGGSHYPGAQIPPEALSYTQLGGVLQYVVIIYSYVLMGLCILTGIAVSILYGYSIYMTSRWISFTISYFPLIKLIIVWLLTIAMLTSASVLGFKFAGKIKKRSDDFLRMWQIMFLIFVVVMFALPLLANGFHIRGVVQSVSYTVTLVITFIVWNLYFTKSVRVRTYMGSDAYLRKSLFNKRTMSPIPAGGVPIYAAAQPAPGVHRPSPAPVTRGDAVQKGTVTCLSGMYQGLSFPLEGNEQMVIGTSPEYCNIVIDTDAQTVGAKHCSIRFDGSARLYLVTDYSQTGTVLSNGSRLPYKTPTPLSPGSVIYLGDNRNSFRIG